MLINRFYILLVAFFLYSTSYGVERIQLSGTPKEMGEQWGKKQLAIINGLKIQFNGMAAIYLKKKPEELTAKALEIGKHLAPEEIEELQGIAAATNSTYESILSFNLFYTLATNNLGCRQFVTWGDKTADGELLHSRNLDWFDYPGSPMKKFNTIVNYKGKNQIEYLLLTWPGFTSALTGINKEGIAIAYNQLPFKNISPYLAEPTFYTIKRALRSAKTLEEVIAIFEKSKPMDAGSIMVSDAKAKKAAVIEIYNGKVAVRNPEANTSMIGNANHPTTSIFSENSNKFSLTEDPACSVAKTIYEKFSLNSVQNIMMHSNVLQPDLNILSVTFKYSGNRMWLSCGKTAAARGPFAELMLFDFKE